MNLDPIDAGIVIGYMLLIFGVGSYMERRAGKNIETYFLAGRSMPWWLLGMSGSSTYFDIAGTMWMVSVFYDLGLKGMWQHCFWCFPFCGFLLAYKAKWAYRSGVLTGMEWLVFRFGRERSGEAARRLSVIMSLVSIVLMLGYAGTGVGKFVEEFLNVDRSISIPLLFGFTGLYVVLGGFFSVVYSDFFQTILLSFAAVYIAVVAFFNIDPEAFRQTVGEGWYSLKPVMQLDNPPEGYTDLFGLLIAMWLTKGLLVLFTASGGPEFQRCRAARNEAEASKIGLAWGVVISVRWSLVMAFTVFGLSIFANNGGAPDSESVLPMVMNRVLPVGIKGLVISGLLAAFMSSFDSTLNVAASFITNDLVKPLWKGISPKTLMWVSYISTLIVVALGIIISMHTESIAAIWNPINFAIGSALIIPGLVAPYWWRIGGWAYCFSGACTLPIAFYIYLFTDLRELQYFPLLVLVSLVSCAVGSFLFPPAPEETLKDFYRKVRPFGFWGPVRRMLDAQNKDSKRFERDRFDIQSAIAGTAFFVALYLFMMDVVLHNWGRMVWLSIILVLTGGFLYQFWWRRLDPEA